MDQFAIACTGGLAGSVPRAVLIRTRIRYFPSILDGNGFPKGIYSSIEQYQRHFPFGSLSEMESSRQTSAMRPDPKYSACARRLFERRTPLQRQSAATASTTGCALQILILRHSDIK